MMRSDDFVIDDAFDDSSCDEDDVASKLLITHTDSVRNTNTSGTIRRKRRVSFSVPLTAISVQPIVQCKSVMKSPGDVASTQQQYLTRPTYTSQQQQQSPSKVLYSGIIPMDRNQDEDSTPSYSDRVADDVVTTSVTDDNDDDACLLLSIVNSFDYNYVDETVTSSTTTPSSITTMDRYHHVDMTMDNTTTLRHQHQYNKPGECYIFVDHDTDTDDDHSMNDQLLLNDSVDGTNSPYDDIKSKYQRGKVLDLKGYDNTLESLTRLDFSNDNDENNNILLTSSLQYSNITMKDIDSITSTNRNDSSNLTMNENLQLQRTARGTGNNISPTKQAMKKITSGINKLKTKFVNLNEKNNDQHHIQHHNSPTLIQKKNHRISDLAVQALSDNYGHGVQSPCNDVNQSTAHHIQSQQVQQEQISSLTRNESHVVFKSDVVQNGSLESPMKQLTSYDNTSTTIDDVDPTKISLTTTSSNDTTETNTTSTNSTDSSSCCSSNQSEQILDDIGTTTRTTAATTTNDINIGTTDGKNGACIQSISLLIHDFQCETPQNLCHDDTPTLSLLQNIHKTNKRAIRGIPIVPWLQQYHNICLFEDGSMILHSFYHVCCQLLSTLPKKNFS